VNILTIQSHVAYGHVGSSAAVFALQRLGVEAWPVHTVQFSNHPGYGAWRGRVFDGAFVADVIAGIAERGVFGGCDGVLSGYIGDPGIGDAVLSAVAAVRAANPVMRYCCDPVIGDVGSGVFVRPGIAEFMRERAVPAADIVTPNHFELDHLVGRPSETLAEALRGVDALHAMGPGTVLVTSLVTRETPPDAIDLLASDGASRYRLRTPRLDGAFNGAGDMLAALFFARSLREGNLADALSLAAASVYGVLVRTHAEGSREILLVAAQDEIVAPSRRFAVERV